MHAHSSETPRDKYRTLMERLRRRFEVINSLQTIQPRGYRETEMCADQLRKIIEGVAFGCLLALENGITLVPRNMTGEYNAKHIFNLLKKRQYKDIFPSPSIIRMPVKAENDKYPALTATIDGLPNCRLSCDDLIVQYEALHQWCHEINPFKGLSEEEFFNKYGASVWNATETLWNFLEKHTISIHGKAFFCVLKDNQDGTTKVVDLTKS